MDALRATLLLALVVLVWAFVRPAPAPVDDRVIAVDGAWTEVSTLPLGVPAWVRDGEALRIAPPPVPPVVCAEATPARDRRLDLNRASLAELDGLPGIGPALAGRIVADRPYRSVEELDRVRGIGAATLARLRPRVRV